MRHFTAQAFTLAAIFLWVFSCYAAKPASAPAAYESQIGIAVQTGDHVCLSIANLRWTPEFGQFLASA
jgi:hypothetical protein